MTGRQWRSSIVPVLVDTGGYYALTAPQDPNHDEAVETAHALARGRYQLYTTHLILAEIHTLLRSRLRHRGRDYALTVARDAVAGIFKSTTIVVAITPEDARRAVDLLFDHPDRVLSYTDATSFAVMRRLAISHVFAFDEDFAAEGFTDIRHILR